MNRESGSPGLATIQQWFMDLQDSICTSLEDIDGLGRFQQDLWERPGGGGGRTRIIKGKLIEKGGVNFSAVFGQMPENIAKALNLPENQFSATGVSIVLHPSNPWVPIIHMNVRYFETDTGHWWFGGGIDASPHFVIPNEAREFHRGLKSVCDKLDPNAYDEYKKWADDYFYIDHRNETRGIGGIFFDRLGNKATKTKSEYWNFVRNVGEVFVPSYRALVRDNRDKVIEPRHREWQMVRRSRYAEFNLVYDKGTKFGLQTKGRIESILMSLPPRTEWHYNYNVPAGTEMEKTLKYLKKEIDWVNYKEG